MAIIIIVIIMYFDTYDFDYTMRKFCNHIGCEGHTKPLQFFDAKYPTRGFYIFDREELEEWFAYICRENRVIRGYCENCFTCEKCHVIKNRLHEFGYFVARDWPYQPVEWQIHEFYLLADSKFRFHPTI